MDNFAAQLSTLKHAHLRSRAFAQARLSKVGLTPSRFELLRALEMEGGSCEQRVLVRKLGVTSATVSKMLRGIRRLGLVSRRRATADKRQCVIALTTSGEERARNGARALQSAVENFGS